MERCFFVTIFAPSRSALANIHKLNLDLDLFGLSSREGEASIDGLLTETQIEQVRKAGFRVEVKEEYVEQIDEKGNPLQPVQLMDDKAWLEEFYRSKRRQS